MASLRNLAILTLVFLAVLANVSGKKVKEEIHEKHVAADATVHQKSDDPKVVKEKPKTVKVEKVKLEKSKPPKDTPNAQKPVSKKSVNAAENEEIVEETVTRVVKVTKVKPETEPKPKKAVPELLQIRNAQTASGKEEVFIPDLAKLKFAKYKPPKASKASKCACPSPAHPTTDTSKQPCASDQPTARTTTVEQRIAHALSNDTDYVYVKLVPIERIPEKGEEGNACPIIMVSRKDLELGTKCLRFLRDQADEMFPSEEQDAEARLDP